MWAMCTWNSFCSVSPRSMAANSVRIAKKRVSHLVRHAAGYHAYGFEPLGLLQPLFQLNFLGHVPLDRNEGLDLSGIAFNR